MSYIGLSLLECVGLMVQPGFYHAGHLYKNVIDSFLDEAIVVAAVVGKFFLFVF